VHLHEIQRFIDIDIPETGNDVLIKKE